MNLSMLLLSAGFFCADHAVVGNSWIKDPVTLPRQVPATGLTKSPFYNENHKYADITLGRGRKLANVRTRIDLFTNTIQFFSLNGVEALLEPGMVKEVSYADTTADGIIFYRFKTGYPPIDGKAANNFYIVLAEGKCSLLRSVEKKVHERKNDMYGNFIREYENIEHFYLQVKTGIKRLQKEKDFLLAELSDKKPQLEQFIEENKLNLRNIDHISKLVNYYNTL